MSESNTGIGALAIYRNGTPGLTSLGGAMLRQEQRRLSCLVTRAEIANVKILWASGVCGVGTGYLTATSADTLAWQSPNGSRGADITVLAGETALIPDDNTNRCIRITRTSSGDMAGTDTVRLAKSIGGTLAVGDLNDTERAAGKDTYASLMLYNQSDTAISNLYAHVATLSDYIIGGLTTVLPSSGAGTIVASGVTTWPASGWCFIRTSAGVTREIVYYTRSGSTLNVAAAHRARLGTSEAAGNAADTIVAIPGIRLGGEAPTAFAIQTITDEETEPDGITWYAEPGLLSGVNVTSLAPGAAHGLWIHRETPPGLIGSPQIENAIEIFFTHSGASCLDSWGAYYRAATDAWDRYELFLGQDEYPMSYSRDDAVAYSATLPFRYAITPPLTVPIVFNATCCRRNAYGRQSANRFPTSFTVDTDGSLVPISISPPLNVSIVGEICGKAYLRAEYFPSMDAQPGDKYAVRITTNGEDPTTAIDPTLVAFEGITGLSSGRKLNLLIGPYAINTIVKVLVSVYRSEDGEESDPADIVSLAISTSELRGVQGAAAFQGQAVELENTEIPASDFGITWIDEANNIRIETDYDSAAFYADTTLIWRCIPSRAKVYVNANVSIRDSGYSGSGSTDAVEVIAWDELDKRISINVSGARRMLIDLSDPDDMSITCGGVSSPAALTALDNAEPVYALTQETVFLVYDTGLDSWRTYLSVNSSGKLKTAFDLAQKTQLEIEAL